MKQTSRDTAVEVFSSVLKNRDKLVETTNLRGVSMNTLFDSTLEAKFGEALCRCGADDWQVVLRREIATMHRVKGLEFNHVIIVSVRDGINAPR